MARQTQCEKAASFLEFHNHAQSGRTLQDLSGRLIGPSQRPISDNTQHSKETDTHAPAEFEPANPASERLQPHSVGGALGSGGLGKLQLFVAKLLRKAQIHNVSKVKRILTFKQGYVQLPMLFETLDRRNQRIKQLSSLQHSL